MNPGKFLLLALALILSYTLDAREIYRWVDNKGKVHFGDRPPNSDTSSVNIVEPPEINGDAYVPANNENLSNTELQERTLNAYRKRRELKQQQAQEQAQREAKKLAARQAKCDWARNYLQQSQGRAIYELDTDGERVYRSDEQIKSDRARIQADYDRYCD